MAKNNKQKKKNYAYNGRDEQIGFKELVDSRRQEMESILPGFYCLVKDPRGKAKDVKVYSVPYMKRQMFSVNPEVEKEAK